MATRATQGGASALPTLAAPSNVVRLPTAAPRKVEQNRNRRTTEARKALPQFTGEHISHDRRNALKDAAIIRDMDKAGVALALALATFDAMPPKTRAGIRHALLKRGGNSAHYQALAVLLQPRNFGQQWDLLWALERLG